MSDRFLQSYHDGDAEASRAEHSYEFLWMAHWMGKSCKSASLVHNQDGAEIEIGRKKIITNDKLAMNMESQSSASTEWRSFPLSSFSQNIGSFSTPRKELAFTDRHVTKSQINDDSGHGSTTPDTSGTDFPFRLGRLASKELEFPSEDRHRRLESIEHNPVQCPESFGTADRKSLPVSGPFLYDLPDLTSNVVSYKYRSGGTPVRSLMHKNKETGQPICQDFDGEKDNRLKAKGPGSSCFRRKDLMLQGTAVKGFSGAEVSPDCSSPQRATDLEELNLGSHLLQKMPVCAVHDVETLRICSTVESVEKVPGDPLRLSKTAHHLYITRKTGVDFFKGDRVISESKLSMDCEGKTFHELLRLSFSGKEGPKLQSLGDSTNSDGKDDIGVVEKDCPLLNKELSAKTDIMNIDDCDTRNSSHGIASLPSNKDFLAGQTPVTTRATWFSSRKVGSKEAEMVRPDICLDPPVVLAAKSTKGKRDLSTSRTQTLEVEAQPSNKLVKRLKLSACDTLAHSLKSSRSRDASSGEKVDKLFTNIMSYNISNKHLHNKQMESGKSMVLFRNSDLSTSDTTKEHQDLTLSHPWIQRWCHSHAEARSMKPTAPVTSEPQISMPTSEKLPRASIAAMALMGRASNCLQPCEFRKRGSVIVWKTEGF